MPKMVKFLLENAVVGIVAGWVLLAYLILSDSFGLGTVIFHSALPILPIFLLMVGFSITFGSVSMGIAIMTLPYLQGGSGGKPSRILAFLSRFVVNAKLLREPDAITIKVQD